MTTMAPEMEALKTRLKATWESGDYSVFAKYLEPGALDFLQRLAIAPGTRMLDVACGAGQIVIPAAHAGIQATGVDIASNLISQAKERAKAEGVEPQFDEGDAEALPYPDGAFDVVTSLFGAMFAPRPELVAAELVRVCRSGGRIVMGNWTPEGHIGQMFKIIGKHVPLSPLMPSPIKWGDEATLRERLAKGLSSLETEKRLYPMVYPFAPAEVVDFFVTYYGPTNRAMAALNPDGQTALRKELEQLWASNNQARDDTTHVESEFLEVRGIRS